MSDDTNGPRKGILRPSQLDRAEPTARVYPAERERERIILGFSDKELLLWWSKFGYCPHPRLEHRLRVLLDKSDPDHDSVAAAQAEAMRRAHIRYSIENLLGRTIPPFQATTTPAESVAGGNAA